jgi:hypothetical protein
MAKKQRLENILGEIVTGIDAASNRLRERRMKREEQSRRWKDEERLRQDRIAMKKTEKERRQELEVQATNLQKAHGIRILANELRRRHDAGVSAFSQEQFDRWSTWAEALARRYDPFENGYFDRAIAYPALYPDLDCEAPEWIYVQRPIA